MPRGRSTSYKRSTTRRTARRKLNTVTTRRKNPMTDALTGMAAAAALKAAKNVYDVIPHNPKATARRTKKRTSGTSSTVKRRKPQSTGAYNQLSFRYDQRKLGKLTLNKILKQSVDNATFTWQNLTRFGAGGGGYHYLSNSQYAGEQYFPMALFELNCIPNMLGGSLTNVAPFWQMVKDATGNYITRPLSGQNPSGALSTLMQLETSDSTSSGFNHPHDTSIQKWFSMEMELWGMKNFPTKYTIDICQFHEDVVPPTGLTGGTITSGEANEFWDSMMKPFSFSPLVHLNSGSGLKKFKLIKRYSVELDPTASFENDARPHCKVFKIFYRLNRTNRYDWVFSGASGATQAEMNNSTWEPEIATGNQTQVHPNARMFMMIRATNFELQADATQVSTTNTPSISLKYRTKHMFSQ